MKKKRFLSLLLMFLIFLGLSFAMCSNSKSIHADSGWDNDYDSGGSWSGDSGSDSSWDYDDDDDDDYRGGWSSGGSSSGSGTHGDYSGEPWTAEDLRILGIVFGSIALIIFIPILFAKIIPDIIENARFARNNIDTKKRMKTDYLNEYIEGAIYYANSINKGTICSKLNGIYKDEAFDIYLKLQNAWSDFDYDTIRSLVTDEMYNMYEMQLDDLKDKNWKNVMTDIKYVCSYVESYNENKDSSVLTMRMGVTLKDYVVDEKNNVVRGDPNITFFTIYELVFIISNEEPIHCCPNCGAEIPTNNSHICDNCKTVIINNTHKLTLAKKTAVQQRKGKLK